MASSGFFLLMIGYVSGYALVRIWQAATRAMGASWN